MSLLGIEEEVQNTVEGEVVPHEVHKVQAQKREQFKETCHCCGKVAHFAKERNFQKARSFECSRRGHIAKMC